MKKGIFIGILFFVFFTIYSQAPDQKMWAPLQESQVVKGGIRQIIPKKYLVYRAVSNSLKEKLFAAPQEVSVKINESSCIITLPAPDGTMQRFHVVQSPVMSPELAASFPQIKTFSIKGIDDPYANGKVDWNEFGFHAMILSINGDFFIDPYSTTTVSDYITYYRADFEKDPAHRNVEVGVITGPDVKMNAPQKKNESGGSYGNKVPASCVGDQLRTYRLAITCTGEYAIAATGTQSPTIAQTLSKVVTTVNRVDGVYEKEVAVRMVLVATTTIVLFTNPATDPFTGNANNDANQLINLSQSVITNSIGTANFDIGHIFSTGGGGLANFGCVCLASQKARGVTGSTSPVGDPFDIDYVAHEIGHQFGGSHTFNALTDNCAGNRNPSTSVEPGSGVTIMAYAGICASNNILNNSIPYFHAISYDEIVNFTQTGNGSLCPAIFTTGNQPPVVTGSGNYNIPKSTPFYLTGSASDPDGDVITYSWEETDPGFSGGNWNSGQRPYFRTYAPIAIPTRLFPRGSVVATNIYTLTKGEYLPSTAQTLNFRLTARDNKMGGGGVCYSNNQVIIDTTGPFIVTYPSSTGITWIGNTQEMVTWDPAFTEQAPVSCDSVRILISYNSGNSYVVLENSAPNFGAYPVSVANTSITITTCRIKVEAIGNVFYDVGDNDFTISTSDVSTGEAILNRNPSLVVWPNPAPESFSFHAGSLDPSGVTTITVIDLLGSTVTEKTYQKRESISDTIDIKDLHPGIYFLKMSNAYNQAVRRVVKN